MDTKEQASQPALQTLKEYAVITADRGTESIKNGCVPW